MAEAREIGLSVLSKNLVNIKEFSTENAIIGEISALIQTKIFSVHGYQEGSIEVGEVGSSNDKIVLDLQKLIIGIKKHGTIRKSRTLLPQMLKDLTNKGVCKQLNDRKFEFAKELLLGDDDKNTKQPDTSPGDIK
jgi:hypothetical protein